MMRTYWIAPAAAILATLLFSPAAKADKWGFSIRVGHSHGHGGGSAHHYSGHSQHGAYYYGASHNRHYYGGRDVYRSGHGRHGYYRGGHYTSRRHGRHYRRHRYYR